jgi:hypothetical protein
MKVKEQAASQYVFLTELAAQLKVGDDTLRRKATALGIPFVKERSPRANNVLTRAIRIEDVKRLAAEFKNIGGPERHVLSPDEISKLMEEA